MSATTLELLPDHVRYWAQRNPDGIAISLDDEEVSYTHLAHLVTEAGERIRAAGVDHGDRVLLAGQNTPGWIVALLAVMDTGAIVVPVNSRLGREQMPGLVERTEPALALVDETQMEAFALVPRGAGGVPIHPLGSGPADALTGLAAPAATTRAQQVQVDDPALLSFTSGTTSAPKAAVISHRALVAGARGLSTLTDFDTTTRTTVLVPLFHNTGYVDQVAQILMAGGQIDLVRRFSSSAAVAALLRRPADFLVAVPSIVRMLMLHERADELLSPCTALGVGGAAMPGAWSRELAERWPQIELFHGYGLTEFTSASHVLPAGQSATRPESVGPPLPTVTCSIRDEAGEELPPGEVGEVWLAGPMRMNEYWRDPDATRRALHGPWLRTGDLGSVDEDDFLTLHGRRDDVINRGGEKITPAVIEDLLAELPQVAQVLVVGIPDPVLGERVVSALQLRDGAATPFDEEAARTHLTGRLPDYSHPDAYIVLDSVPLRQTGKVDRHHVRQMLIDRLGTNSRQTPTQRQEGSTP